mmetsp:Transcript_72044/g.142862  ORF Transcript_72044/g.142862 Transcript_72044/m.142862 type:complete len:200 (-) Transcript_72044:717-1316(-)
MSRLARLTLCSNPSVNPSAPWKIHPVVNQSTSQSIASMESVNQLPPWRAHPVWNKQCGQLQKLAQGSTALQTYGHQAGTRQYRSAETHPQSVNRSIDQLIRMRRCWRLHKLAHGSIALQIMPEGSIAQPTSNQSINQSITIAHGSIALRPNCLPSRMRMPSRAGLQRAQHAHHIHTLLLLVWLPSPWPHPHHHYGEECR